MTQRIGGTRRKSRYKSKKPRREKGKLKTRKYLEEYKAGDKVLLKPEPFVQKGLFHLRFSGRSGIINRKTGRCYEVRIKDSAKEKKIIVHPVHLKRC